MGKALSKKEIEIIEELIAHGLSNRKIAECIGRSPASVSLIRNGTREEKCAKAREKWRKKHSQQPIQDEEVEHPEQHSYSYPWDVGEEMNKLTLAVNCLTAALYKLIDIVDPKKF